MLIKGGYGIRPYGEGIHVGYPYAPSDKSIAQQCKPKLFTFHFLLVPDLPMRKIMLLYAQRIIMSAPHDTTARKKSVNLSSATEAHPADPNPVIKIQGF
jgi:hypothetical protein